MDTGNFWSTVTGLFIATNVIIGVITVFKVYIWTKHNSSLMNPESYCTNMIIAGVIILIRIWGDIMFFFLFFVTGYWFVFFKMQDNVFCLIPDPITLAYEYYPFRVVFALMATCQVLSIIDTIRKQTNVDIVVLDWVNFRF